MARNAAVPVFVKPPKKHQQTMAAITIAYHNRPISELFYEFIAEYITPNFLVRIFSGIIQFCLDVIKGEGRYFLGIVDVSFLYDTAMLAKTIRAIAISITTIPFGAWVFNLIDYWLKIINETLVWSTKNNNRSVSWLIFVPLLMTVQYFRFVTSCALLLTTGSKLKNNDLKTYIDVIRGQLQDVILKGQDNHKAAMLKRSSSGNKEHGFIADKLYKLMGFWPFRPVANLFAYTLYFFGLTYTLPKGHSQKKKEEKGKKETEQEKKEKEEKEKEEKEKKEKEDKEREDKEKEEKEEKEKEESEEKGEEKKEKEEGETTESTSNSPSKMEAEDQSEQPEAESSQKQDEQQSEHQDEQQREEENQENQHRHDGY